MKDNIKVIIKPEPFFSDRIYIDNTNCYLARELIKAGYKDVRVCGDGRVIIDGDHYCPVEESPFNGHILRVNFANNVETVVELTSSK